MPEHVHLLIGEPQSKILADVLKSLKHIRNEEQFVQKLRYVHRNPVKAGLCEHPEDWEWSSFRHYATGIEGRVEIESEATAAKRERAAGRLCMPVELPHSSQQKA